MRVLCGGRGFEGAGKRWVHDDAESEPLVPGKGNGEVRRLAPSSKTIRKESVPPELLLWFDSHPQSVDSCSVMRC